MGTELALLVRDALNAPGSQEQVMVVEAVKLFDEGFIRAAAKNNDWGFYSFFKSGWKRFYLKWYDDFLPSARTLCPKTVQLLNSIPTLGLQRAEVLSDDRDCWADRGVGVAMMRVGWICNPPS